MISRKKLWHPIWKSWLYFLIFFLSFYRCLLRIVPPGKGHVKTKLGKKMGSGLTDVRNHLEVLRKLSLDFAGVRFVFLHAKQMVSLLIGFLEELDPLRKFVSLVISWYNVLCNELIVCQRFCEPCQTKICILSVCPSVSVRASCTTWMVTPCSRLEMLTTLIIASWPTSKKRLIKKV